MPWVTILTTAGSEEDGPCNPGRTLARHPPHTHQQIWISPDTGLGKELAALLSSVGSSSEVTMVLILTLFGVVHSGLAALRPQGELELSAVVGRRGVWTRQSATPGVKEGVAGGGVGSHGL